MKTYHLRTIDDDTYAAARMRAIDEGRSLRWVILCALAEYAAGTWTPRVAETRLRTMLEGREPVSPVSTPPDE